MREENEKMARNKKNNDYFKLLEQQVSCSVEASNLLEKIFCEFDPRKYCIIYGADARH